MLSVSSFAKCNASVNRCCPHTLTLALALRYRNAFPSWVASGRQPSHPPLYPLFMVLWNNEVAVQQTSGYVITPQGLMFLELLIVFNFSELYRFVTTQGFSTKSPNTQDQPCSTGSSVVRDVASAKIVGIPPITKLMVLLPFHPSFPSRPAPHRRQIGSRAGVPHSRSVRAR